VKEKFTFWKGKKAVAFPDMNHKDIEGNTWYDELNIINISENRKWNSPMFMPRWASRITLEVISDVRIENLQDITAEDALKEGFHGFWTESETLDAFCEVWQTNNAKRGYPWKNNPPVYVLGFKVVSK